MTEPSGDRDRHATDLRIRTSKNMVWTPRPGWVTVRLVGTCADPALRRGQVVTHAPSDDGPVPFQEETLGSGTMVIVLSEAAHLVEDDLHLIPEHAIIAIGDRLP